MTKNLLMCAFVLTTAFAAVGAGHPGTGTSLPSATTCASDEPFIPPSFDIEISPLPAAPDAAAEAQRFEH